MQIFEKENINTLLGDGETILAILPSFAQGKSKNESDNFIDSKEAEVVRRIFNDDLSEKGCFIISKELNAEGVPTIGGAKWHDVTILGILKNEKYKGDAILQKYYTPKNIRKRSFRNKGQVDSYYIEDNHSPIVTREMWEQVQEEIKRRAEANGNFKGDISKLDYVTVDNAFAGRVICGHCGSTFWRKVWNSNNEKLRRIIWRCNKKYTVKGEKNCENKHIYDRVLSQAFINTFNAMIENKDYFIGKWNEERRSENVLLAYKAGEFIKIIKNAEQIKEFDMDFFLG